MGCGRCAGGSGESGGRGCGEANLGWLRGGKLGGGRWAALGATTRTTTRTMLTDEMDDDGERARRRMGKGWAEGVKRRDRHRQGQPQAVQRSLNRLCTVAARSERVLAARCEPPSWVRGVGREGRQKSVGANICSQGVQGPCDSQRPRCECAVDSHLRLFCNRHLLLPLVSSPLPFLGASAVATLSTN